MKKSKIVALALAGTLTATAMLAGTYAWTAISQQALNESAGEVNPGARLHDDFDGTNKDIYVENFTTEEEDGAIIYARIKLDEYLSLGTDAGTTEGDATAIKLDGEAPEFADPSTWTTYKLGETTDFRYYFDLVWGDDEDEGGAVAYMPTFNKNKDSLEADINGTYVGKDGIKDSKDAYDDYLTYADGAGAYDPDTYTLGTPIGEMTSVEIYDIDGDETNEDKYLYASIIETLTDGKGVINTVAVNDTIPLTNENNTVNATITKVEPADGSTPITAVELNLDPDVGEDDGADIRVVANQKHTVETTATTTDVITMDQWKALNCPIGAYWVYDKDGWAYWAQGIAPGETTGCLLTGIERSGTISMKYYYGINVTAEFATAGDWGKGTANQENSDGEGFYINGISDDGLMLLNTIAGNEKKLIVTSSAEAVRPGESITLDAKIMLGATETTGDTVEWTISSGDEVASIVSTSATTAELTVKDSTTELGINVTAKIKGTNVEVEKAITIKDVYTVTVTPTETVEYLVPENEDTLTFTASVTSRRENGPAYTGITWELEGATADDTTLTASTGNEYEATLKLGKYEDADKITVKAICKADTEYYGEYQITVYTQLEYLDELSKNPDNLGLATTTIKIDGIKWYVLARQDAQGVDDTDDEEVLLWSTQGVTGWGGPNNARGWAFWSEDFAFTSAELKEEMLALGGEENTDWENANVVAVANWWKYSNARAWLNYGDDENETEDKVVADITCAGFLKNKEILSQNAAEVTIQTKREYNDEIGNADNYESTKDKIFLLTQADIYGHTTGTYSGTELDLQATPSALDYTVSGMSEGKLLQDVEVEDGTTGTKTEVNAVLMRYSRNLDSETPEKNLRELIWLRSPRANGNNLANINAADSIVTSNIYHRNYIYLRPALWMNLTSSSQGETGQ